MARPAAASQQVESAMCKTSTAPGLSICIVSWNTRELLRDCLYSIGADPAAAGWEVIVVDNASRDGTVAMVQRCFPRVDLVAGHENLGFAAANNLALRRARSKYLLLLNPDTRVEPGALGALVEFMEGRPEAGASGPKLLSGDGSLQLSCGAPMSMATETINKLLLHKLLPYYKLGGWRHGETREVGWVTGACLLVRRAAVAQAGMLDSRIFMFHEDVEWCMRIRQAGWRIFYYPGAQVLHLGGQSTRKSLGDMLVVSQRSLFYLFQKHFGPRQLLALRALTVVEMVLRSSVWGGIFLMWPPRRAEFRQRLRAYREILRRTLVDRSYWAPRHPGATERR